MAISFPDTVSAGVEFSDGAMRADTAFRGQSQAVVASDGCGLCSAVKPCQATDDEFDSVLAWMIFGISQQLQPTLFVDKTETTPAPVTGETDAGKATDSLGIVQTAGHVGLAASTSVSMGHPSAPPAVSQNVVSPSEVFASAVPVGVGNPEPPTTTGIVADTSLNGSVPLSRGRSSIATVTRIGVQSDQDISNTDSIGGVGFQSQELRFLSPVTGEVTGKSVVQTKSFHISVTIESEAAVDPEAVSQNAVGALARSDEFPGLMTSEASRSASPKTVPAVSALPVSWLPDNTVSAFTDSGSELSASASSAAASSAADNSEFRRRHDLHPAAASTSDIVPGDAVQLNAANSFSEVATSVSGEVRQPLSNQVSQAIMEHIERSSVRSSDSLTVRLDPPELGEMKIELSKTLDGLAVRVTAREAVTMDMLFDRGQEIESQLRGQQLNLKSLEFLHADLSGNTFSQGQQQDAESRAA